MYIYTYIFVMLSDNNDRVNAKDLIVYVSLGIKEMGNASCRH